MDLNALTEAGFKQALTAEQREAKNAELAESELSRGGEYRIDYALTRDKVTITVEQNTGAQSRGDLEMSIKYPPVAVVEGPGGRVACSPDNTGLLLRLADELG